MKKLLLVLAAAATLTACGQKSTPVEETPPPAAPSADGAAPAAPATPPTAAEIDKAATATQESAGDAAAPGDATLERLVAMPESAQLPGGRWKAGVHYRPLAPAQPTSVPAGNVEVIEFMWLACGGCYLVNERAMAWKSRLPEWVKFRQEHVMWGPSHRGLAKLLYTLEMLGRSDLVGAAFEEIHRKNNMLVTNDEAGTLQKQLAFAKANGISEADFKREYNGFAVNTRLQKAEELTRRYKIDQTPVFVVNGKYLIDTRMARVETELFPLLDDLVAFEKK
jgi:thiol:disulfide interchange protein DsbA